MSGNLESSIVSISDTDFETLFNSQPEGSPSSKDLAAAKETVKKVEEDEKVIIDNTLSPLSDLETVENLDELLDEKKSEEKKDSKKSKSEEKDKEIDDKEEVEDKEENEEVNSVLKNTVNFLIEKGHWLDFEGREDLKIDEKIYAELTAKQDEARLNGMFSELLDSTGPYGKAIIEHVKQGGNPEEVIDIFKEQKQVENFDIKSDEGQKLIINKYYKDVLGWKSERIERHISKLIASEELETESVEIKDLFDKHHEKELEEITKAQQEATQKEIENQEKFKRTIVGTIQNKKELTTKEKKELERSILQYSNRLPSGELVSDFYVQFAKVQSNPEEYIDLVSFVMNKEGYLEKVKKQLKNKAVDETFNFVKGNIALSKQKGSSHDKIEREDKKIAPFNFGFKSK